MFTRGAVGGGSTEGGGAPLTIWSRRLSDISTVLAVEDRDSASPEDGLAANWRRSLDLELSNLTSQVTPEQSRGEKKGLTSATLRP